MSINVVNYGKTRNSIILIKFGVLLLVMFVVFNKFQFRKSFPKVLNRWVTSVQHLFDASNTFVVQDVTAFQPSEPSTEDRIANKHLSWRNERFLCKLSRHLIGVVPR